MTNKSILDNWEELTARNTAHQSLIKLTKGEKFCSDCFRELEKKIKLVSSQYCAECYGEDPYGEKLFCPRCNYCCGC